MTAHEDEIITKAYDGRLMRRLLAYLGPHRRWALAALGAIVAGSLVQLAQPYLVKVAIDDYIAAGDLPGMTVIAGLFLLVLAGAFACEYAQTWLMQLMGQRIMFDIRLQVYGHLQRVSMSYYDRHPACTALKVLPKHNFFCEI